MIQIDREITQDYERALGLEWLETNGLGGWAGTTVAGAHSRRYHGLLVAATEPPSQRMVLLSRLDKTLHLDSQSEASTGRLRRSGAADVYSNPKIATPWEEKRRSNA